MDDRHNDVAELLRQKERQQYWASSKRTPTPQKKYKPSVKRVEDYVVLDFETTGLRPGGDKIIQVGAVKYKNHEQVDVMNQLVDPLLTISPRITFLTGISNDMVKNKPNIDRVILHLIEFIGELPIVAHNASFDMGFLYALDDNSVEVPSYTVIDTLKLARKVIHKTPNHKLTTLSNYLQLEHNAHDALSDCLVTASIYQYCLRNSI